MPVHIGELKLVTKLKAASADLKDKYAAHKNTKQVASGTKDEEALIRECIRRMMEILEYKLR